LQPMGKGAMESRNGDDKSQYEGGWSWWQL
jgi:hypothetical protein